MNCPTPAPFDIRCFRNTGMNYSPTKTWTEASNGIISQCPSTSFDCFRPDRSLIYTRPLRCKMNNVLFNETCITSKHTKGFYDSVSMIYVEPASSPEVQYWSSAGVLDCTGSYTRESLLACKLICKPSHTPVSGACSLNSPFCEESDANSCIKCKSGYFKAGPFLCSPCHPSCESCTGSLATDCSKCSIGLTYSSDSSKCIPLC